MPRYSLILLIFFLAILSGIASATPNVTLISPGNGNSIHNNNITLFCNASDTINNYNITLFHNINGSFSANSTKYLMELENDGSTLLLCHFNEFDNYTCEGGETGTNISTSFVESPFIKGLFVGESASVRYPTTNNLVSGQGTIEFWVNPGVDTDTGTYYLFDMNVNNENDIQIRITDGILYFSLIDDNSNDATAYADMSSWNVGEWHHIAALWDLDGDFGFGNIADLYLDGSNVLDTYDNNDYAFSLLDSYFYLGNSADSSQDNEIIIDELRISNATRTSEEINSSFNKLADFRNASANFTFSNITDGAYIWNCLGYNNESEYGWSNQNFSFNIDLTTWPNVNSVVLTPNSTDDMDPATTVNATANITDASGVESVTFQWKKVGDWNDIIMDFDTASGLYVNASIAIDVTGGVYYYRIWSEDTLENSGYSDTHNFSANYDYSWTLLPAELGQTTSYINDVNNIGNLTINNTGDDTLQFSMADNWPFSVFYNGSESPLFTVPAKSTIVVQVNATFEQQDSERNITINITASHPTQDPVPESRTVQGRLITYTGGAYLTVILTTPVTANQSRNATLTATVKNIGNETAENVWLNWSLPSGWANSSGYLELYVGNISPQATNTSAINVMIAATAESGISSICMNASGSNAENFSCSSIQIYCTNSDGTCGGGCSYLNDNDCSIPNSGGGSSGATSTSYTGVTATSVIMPRMIMTAATRTDAFRGEKVIIYGSINNPEKKTYLHDIIISADGYNPKFTAINPNEISYIEYGETVEFKVEIDIQNYTPFGPYPIDLSAIGIASISNASNKSDTNVQAFSSVQLFVHSTDEELSNNLFARAGASLEKMQQMGFSSDKAAELYDEAKLAIENYDFDSAKNLAGQVINIEEKAGQVNELFNRIDANFREGDAYGIEMRESEKMSLLSQAAFGRGDYSKAQERAERTIIIQGLEIGDKISTSKFSANMKGTLAYVIIIILLASIVGFKLAHVRKIKMKIKLLNKEEKSIERAIKDMQSAFFKENRMGQKEYASHMEAYGKRKAEIRREQSRLSAGSSGIFSLRKGRESPEKQKKNLNKLMEESQKSYFEKGAISKDDYDRIMRGLKTELAEANRKMPGQNGKSKGARIGTGKYATILIIFLMTTILFSASGVAQSTGGSDSIFMEAQQAIIEMEQLGLPTMRANNTLEEAMLLQKNNNSLGAESLARYVLVIKEKAISSMTLIDQAETRIIEAEAQGIDTAKLHEIFNNGLLAFGSERFEEALVLFEEALNGAEDSMADLSKNSLAIKSEDPFRKFINTYRIYIIYAFWFAAAGIIIITIIHYKISIRRKVKLLRSERKSILAMIKSIQKRYFEEGKMPKSEYDSALGQYQRRLGDIKKGLGILSDTENRE